MHQTHGSSGHGGRLNLAFLGLAIVAGFFLLTEHRAHVFGALPYVLLALCPLMHLLGHGHGSPGHHGHAGDDAKGPKENGA